MSLLNKYSAMEQEMRELQEKLELLKGDDRLKEELEFKEHLESLMKEYNKSVSDVIKLLNPTGRVVAARTGARRPRRVKVYKHPESGEIIETRGGNHKILKSWKEEHGADEVESWLQEVREP